MTLHHYTKFMNIYLYGSIHIGLCAMAMSWQTYYLLDNKGTPDIMYLMAVFMGTTGFYAYHRLADLPKLMDLHPGEKYKNISGIRNSILVISILCSLTSLILFFFLKFVFMVILAIGSTITLLYSHSLSRRVKKLREMGYLKIFLIALVWGAVTALIPSLESGTKSNISMLVFLERSLFIFALTLPFDIRDLRIDQQIKVRTIPMLIGKQTSLTLALLILLCIQPAINYYLVRVGIYQNVHFMILFATNIIISWFVWRSGKIEKDFYFTGILDGMMLFQPIAILILSA